MRRRLRRWQALPRLALVALALVVGLRVGGPLLGPRGELRDAQTDAPLVGASVRAGAETEHTSPSGSFQLGLIPPWQMVEFEAEGYEPQVSPPWPVIARTVALLPRSAEVRVIDGDTGQPVAATLESDFGRTQPLGPGRFRVAPIRGGSLLSARADGFVARTITYSGGHSFELPLTPLRVGRVVDATTEQPVPHAVIMADEQLYTADAAGQFELAARPRRPVRVTAPGFRRLEVDTNASGSLELRLEPFVVRGLYLTFYGVGDETLRGNAVRLLETTEANTLVVDVKGDRGFLAYPSRVPLADQIGANKNHTLPGVDRFLADLHGRGFYVIARIVVFKDDLLARNGASAGLDLAIKDQRTGKPWLDGEGLAWVDPFRQEAWDYNIALAREAAERGFDEVQFDYIRFPTDPSAGTSVGAARYSQEPNEESRPAALAGFLAGARQALRPLGAFLSIDTFGYACFRDDDMGIGQNLAVLAPHVDYISPMVYPSTYTAGLPGRVNFPAVVSRPYDVVFTSLEEARGRVAGRGALLRPWLQYFDDYLSQTGRAYNAPEMEAQKKAVADSGAIGWMFWDPTNRYARGGLQPR